MCVTVEEDKEVTVITIKIDNKSMLCQIPEVLCCSPVYCKVYKGLMQTNVTTALGIIQIMVGLFNIGLGPGRMSLHPGDLAHLGAAYWLGAVYIAAGIMAIYAGWYPSLCVVGFAVFVNLVGSVFAIIGIVLYAIDLGDPSVISWCNWNKHNTDNYGDTCIYVAYFAQRLLTGMNITLIILAVLQLCVCISFAVLGIKALGSREKKEVGGDVEIYQPLLKEVMISPGA